MTKEKTLSDKKETFGYFGEFIRVDKIDHHIKKLQEELEENLKLRSKEGSIIHIIDYCECCENMQNAFLYEQNSIGLIFKKHIGELK